MKIANSTWTGLLLSITLTLASLHACAQGATFWHDAHEVMRSNTSATRTIVPSAYRFTQFDMPNLELYLETLASGHAFEAKYASTILNLPLPDGRNVDFKVIESSIMEPALQAVFPNIRTYAGHAIGQKNLSVRFDVTPKGFHAMILGDKEGAIFIDPFDNSSRSDYQVYYKSAYTKQLPTGFSGCHYQDVNDPDMLAPENMLKGVKKNLAQNKQVGDCQLRTYRLALACTGEYANFHGSNTTNNDKSLAAAAMVTSMNRVNGIYEKEATVTMVIVAGNDDLIFLDAANDPYSNTNGSAMLGQNQTTCDNTIGAANYDIGHVFSTGGGGVAYLRSPCASNKAGGVTGQNAPINDPFDVDYVAHEIGHQFGGNHTQNNSCNRSSLAAREPGSASSIMGYAGICAPNVQSNSDATFHGYSIQEIHTFITGIGNSCAQVTALTNNPPTADAGANQTIPQGTPFVLEGIGTDADGDVLSYKWDQMDNQVAMMPPVATSTGGPSFRSYVPQESPNRYLPRLSDLVNGTDYDWEELNTVSRTYNFRLTVLDNAAGAGCNDQSDKVVEVDGTTGPFVVLSPNTATTWAGFSNETVTWDVAGTDGGAVNAANVDIFLSVDGGFTYPYQLASSVPNNGSAVVSVPDVPNTSSRIMVRGNGNIFFDISDEDFTITQGAPDYALDVSSPSLQACIPTNSSVQIQVSSLLGYSDPVNLTVTGLPAGVQGTFTSATVVPGNSTTLNITGTSNAAPGNYAFVVSASSTSGNKTLNLNIQLDADPIQVTLSLPADAALINGGEALVWNTDVLASSYEIELAQDLTFTNVVESANVSQTQFSPVIATLPSTTYYWRVRSVNPCSNGLWSTIRSFTTNACVNVTVQITLDRYGSEITWNLTDGTTVFATGGPYTDEASAGEYPQPSINLCLPLGCYQLNINDSFGDGLCCTSGNGIIEVVDDSNGSTYASGASFTSTVSVGFEIGAAASCIDGAAYVENFDVALCGLEWSNVNTDDFDWTLNDGGTPSNDTGPAGDHTTGSGNYYYTESSSPVDFGDVAILESNCINPVSGALALEVAFWYHMYGAEIGSLSLSAFDGTSWQVQQTISGNQGNAWQELVSYVPANTQQLRIIAEVGTLGNSYQNDFAIDDVSITSVFGTEMQAKVFLEGPYDSGAGIMKDDLRVAGLIPLEEPFSALGFQHVNGGGEQIAPNVLAATGGNAIVDWLFIELRDATDSTIVVMTQAALLQADGDVVSINGIDPVFFEVIPGAFFYAVKHRNHLGFMSANPLELKTGNAFDFSDGTAAIYGSEPLTDIAGVKAMWMGNVIDDANIKYTGASNDRDPILSAVGGAVPTATLVGYLQADINLDGVVKYTGAANDRDPILVNIGGSIPTAIRTEQLP